MERCGQIEGRRKEYCEEDQGEIMEMEEWLARTAWLKVVRQHLGVGLTCSKDRWYLAFSRSSKCLAGTPAEISRSANVQPTMESKERRFYTTTIAQVNLGEFF